MTNGRRRIDLLESDGDFIKTKFALMTCLLMITYVFGNIFIAYLSLDIRDSHNTMAIIPLLLSIFMVGSIFFFHNSITYKINEILIVISFIYALYVCFVLCFAILYFAVIFVIWGAVNFRIFSSKSIRRHFGVEDTDNNNK